MGKDTLLLYKIREKWQKQKLNDTLYFAKIAVRRVVHGSIYDSDL